MSLLLRRGLTMASQAPKEPLLAIIGATGTGKSKLAVELATRFNGEIINGDAMQMYKGLPIITNKMPEQERNGIPHHLLDFIGLDEQPWTVANFVGEAQKIIKEIRARGKLPVLVGGTHYYTQALLFQDSLLARESDDSTKHGEKKDGHSDPKWLILSAPTSDMYTKLQEVDPAMAQRWHPKDRRHIRRSLEIWLQTGVKASEIYGEQEKMKLRSSNEAYSDSETSTSEKDVPRSQERLRWPTLIFWVNASDGNLKERLNTRVDNMTTNGLLDEANDMLKFVQAKRDHGLPLDRSRGIWVSIGFKEVEPYLLAMAEGTIQNADLSRLRERCIEAVKSGTRQYAKRQNRWIRISLSNALLEASALSRLFLLDCTDLDVWSDSISAPSASIAEAFLKGGELPDPRTLSALANDSLSGAMNGAGKVEISVRECEECGAIVMSGPEWDRHKTSKGHKRVLDSRRRRAENEVRRCAANLRRDTASEVAE